MTDDEGSARAAAPARRERGDRPDGADSPRPITPDDEPSALERGVRIFERLRRSR